MTSFGGGTPRTEQHGLQLAHHLTCAPGTLLRRPNTTYVPGFFNQTLTAALLRLYPFQPALFVDIDCDLFTSTWQALDWLCKLVSAHWPMRASAEEMRGAARRTQ